MNIPKELQELRANVENLSKKYKEIKAMPESEMPKDHDKMKEMEDMMMSMMDYTHSRISYLENDVYSWFAEHEKNHLPNPTTPSDMQHCLDALGLAKDYDVKKRTIYASMNDGKGVLFDVIK